jgi:branched-chain amino acid transport system substrate-binding protein
MAGVCSSATHYVKVLAAFGGDPHDGVKAVGRMKDMPTAP